MIHNHYFVGLFEVLIKFLVSKYLAIGKNLVGTRQYHYY